MGKIILGLCRCPTPTWAFGLVVQSNGSRLVKRFCTSCRDEEEGFVRYDGNRFLLPVLRDNRAECCKLEYKVHKVCVIAADGRETWWWACSECQTRLRHSREPGCWIFDEIVDYRNRTPCIVCGSLDGTQRHHWAPRAFFGAECEKWPTADLCRECHGRWHAIVTPHITRRSA